MSQLDDKLDFATRPPVFHDSFWLDILPDPVMLLSGEFIIYANPSFYESFGIDRNRTELVPEEIFGKTQSQKIFSSYNGSKADGNEQEKNFLFNLKSKKFLVRIRPVAIHDRAEPQLLICFHEQNNDTAFFLQADDIHDATIITDSEGKIFTANISFRNLTGYNTEETVGKNIKDFFSEEKISLTTGKGNQLHEFLTKSGEKIFLEIGASNYSLAEKNFSGRIFTLHDRSREHALEEALKESRKKYQQLVVNAPVGVARYKIKEEKYEFINTEFSRQSGYSLDELNSIIKGKWFESIHPDDRASYIDFLRNWSADSYRGLKRILYRTVNPSGKIVWLDTHFFADFDQLGEPEAINEISVNVTDLKEAEAALTTALQEDFSHIVRNLQNLVFRLYIRDDGKWAYSLREGKLAGGLTTEKVKGKTPVELFGQDYIDHSFHNVESAALGNDVQYETYHEGQWQLISLVPIKKDGVVSEIIGSGIDITERKNTENKLQESEKKFRTVLDYLPIGILYHERNKNGEVISEYMNPAALNQGGYTTEDLRHLSNSEMQALIHKDDIKEYTNAQMLWRQSDYREVLHLTYRYKVKSGEYRWFDNYALRLPAENGKNSTIQAALDVTERKNVEEELRTASSRMETLIRNLNSGVMVIDREEILVLINDVIGTLFGLKNISSYVGVTADEINEQLKKLFKSADDFEKRIKEITTGNEPVYGEELLLTDGRIFERDCTPVFIDGILDGWIWQYRDITNRKQAEKDLLKALEKEREVSMLRSRFVSTVSHEFRTPLTGILMSAELLELYNTQMSNDDRIVQIGKIKSRVEELVTLLNDFLLQSSAISLRDRFMPSPVSIVEIIQQVAGQLEQYFGAKKQNLKFIHEENIPDIQADRKLLQHILENLLSNASKYSPVNSTISITVWNSDKNVMLEVGDQGIGIPPGELENLFTPYFRASNVAKMPGTGLGLSITKEFVELHRGKISVESELGSGTKFLVTLPIFSLDLTTITDTVQ